MTREDVLRVTDEMVEAAVRDAQEMIGFDDWSDNDLRNAMRGVLKAALAVAPKPCPVCHAVNPAEVHTCTPAPKVTVLDEWRVVRNDGVVINGAEKSYAKARDRSIRLLKVYFNKGYTFTVRRVALLEDDK